MKTIIVSGLLALADMAGAAAGEAAPTDTQFPAQRPAVRREAMKSVVIALAIATEEPLADPLRRYHLYRPAAWQAERPLIAHGCLAAGNQDGS